MTDAFADTIRFGAETSRNAASTIMTRLNLARRCPRGVGITGPAYRQLPNRTTSMLSLDVPALPRHVLSRLTHDALNAIS